MAKRKKPVKRRKVRSDCGISRKPVAREIPFEELTPTPNELLPDPMLVAYIDEIHKAASARDRRIFEAKQKFAWALADAWQRWKEEV